MFGGEMYDTGSPILVTKCVPNCPEILLLDCWSGNTTNYYTMPLYVPVSSRVVVKYFHKDLYYFHLGHK